MLLYYAVQSLHGIFIFSLTLLPELRLSELRFWSNQRLLPAAKHGIG
ncbi:MAG: hypothetical protein AAF639_34980 [Chloroflexota bacterium]